MKAHKILLDLPISFFHHVLHIVPFMFWSKRLLELLK
jgi:hypothetical protein